METREGQEVPIEGAEAVARQILKRGRPFAPLARPAIVNGAAGAIVMPGHTPIAVAGFTVVGGRVAEIDLIANPDKLRGLSLGASDT